MLLETMHEDLNAISKKPYVEMKDSAGRPDEVVAAEFWDGLKRRDDSIFVRLFYGQLKSRVNCSICGHISITFDPYNVLSVPIPRQSNSSTYSIKFYPLSFVRPVIELTMALPSGDRTTIGEMKDKVRSGLLEVAQENNEDVTIDDISAPIICVVRDNQIHMMARNDFEIGRVDRGFKLVAIER